MEVAGETARGVEGEEEFETRGLVLRREAVVGIWTDPVRAGRVGCWREVAVLGGEERASE